MYSCIIPGIVLYVQHGSIFVVYINIHSLGFLFIISYIH